MGQLSKLSVELQVMGGKRFFQIREELTAEQVAEGLYGQEKFLIAG
jgi:hypothetical protein